LSSISRWPNSGGVDSTDTETTMGGSDSDVTVFSPVTAPGVLDDVVLFSLVNAPSDSDDGVVGVGSAFSSVENSTRVCLEINTLGVKHEYDWLFFK
jgi:hypothetical protein